MSYKYKPDDFKTLIPLDELMFSYGFEYVERKSSGNWPVLSNPNNGNKYLVKKNKYNSQWFYVNLETDDKGNVFNFLRSHNPDVINFSGSEKDKNKKINVILQNFIDNTSLDTSVKNEIKKYKKETFIKSLDDFNRKPIYDYKFLNQQRLISIDIINHPFLKDTIFNTHYQFSSGHIAVNTGFGKYNELGEIKGLEIYYETSNESKSSIAGDPSSLWYSKINPSKKISGVFFAESAKDAISYFELLYNINKDNENFNPLFISISGNLDANGNKLETMKKILSNQTVSIDNQTKFYSITDNDFAGSKYDVQFNSLVNNLHFDENHRVKNNENFQIYTLPFEDNIYQKWENEIKSLNKILDNKLGNDVNNFGKYFILKKEENNLQIFIPKSREFNYRKTFINSFNKLHFEPKEIFGLKLHKTNLKELNGDLDWSAHLMYKKNKLFFLNRQLRHANFKMSKRLKKSVNNASEKKNEIINDTDIGINR